MSRPATTWRHWTATQRALEAAARAIGQIEGLSEHLPLECPRADVGIVYHPESQELFDYNDEDDRFLADLRGVYRTLWSEGITPDVITPRMDWSGYRQLFLPNLALMDEATLEPTCGER